MCKNTLQKNPTYFLLPSSQAALWWHVCSTWLDKVHSEADITPVFCRGNTTFNLLYPTLLKSVKSSIHLTKLTEYDSSSCLTKQEDNSLPADVTEAVQPGFCILAGSRGVEASLAWLVEKRSVVVPVIWVVQLHVNHTAGWTMTLAVLLLLQPHIREEGRTVKCGKIGCLVWLVCIAQKHSCHFKSKGEKYVEFTCAFSGASRRPRSNMLSAPFSLEEKEGL